MATHNSFHPLPDHTLPVSFQIVFDSAKSAKTALKQLGANLIRSTVRGGLPLQNPRAAIGILAQDVAQI